MSSITRLAVEAELAERDGGLMTFVGKSAVASGSNPSFGSAIGFAAQLLGVSPVTPGAIVDSDLAGLDPSRFVALCDLAEYRLIKSCLNNFVQTNEQAQDRRQDWATLRAQFQAQADALQRQYAALLNIRRNPTRVGPINYNHPTPNSSSWGIGDGRYDH